MGSPLEALLVIPIGILMILVIFLALTFMNSVNYGENNLGTAGFDNIQPQMKQTHYYGRGEFITTFKTVSKNAVNITSITISDKIDDEDCKIIKTSRKNNLKYWDLINVTASCPDQNTGTLYTLEATITYVTNKSSTPIEETGNIIGNIE